MAVATRAAGVDLEAVEGALREAVLAAGAKVLEALLRDVGVGRRETAVRCRCGTPMRSSGTAAKTLYTLLGEVRFERSRYACPACGKARYPGDEELGVVKTSRSPGLQRQTARLGAKEPFAEVAKDLEELAGVTLSRKDAERISEGVGEAMETWDKVERERLRLEEPPAPEDTPKTIETLYIEYDGTGVPMVPHEVAGRTGKQKDGTAKTREAKLGCVFTQTSFDEKGRPIRDPASTTFTGAIENAERFGQRIYAEAVRRGLFEATRVAILTDGAQWCKNLAEIHFPNAIRIVDLYHAREHVHDLCKRLFDRDLKRITRYRERWWEWLDEGNIEGIVEQATSHLPKDPSVAKDARREINYLTKNKERMRYAHFKTQGLFLGSGVIEAACKTVIGKRLKQSGMEWTVRGANAIIALRCTELSRKTEDYWEQRAG